MRLALFAAIAAGRSLRGITGHRTLLVLATGATLQASACGRDPAAPAEDGASPPPAADAALRFPDSVTAGHGLPPRATDSTTYALGGDTLVVSHVAVFEAYAVRPSQVAPGSPTTGSMRLEVRVFARDTSQGVLRDRLLSLAECPITLRLHRSADRSDAPAWRSDVAPSTLACPGTTQFRQHDYTFRWDVPTILGDSLAAGRYAFAYEVRLADGRVLEYENGSAYLTADTRPPTRDRSALRMTARSEVVGQGPRRLHTTVVVRNTGTRAVQFERGACTPSVRLYRGPSLVWRSELRGASVGGGRTLYACPAILLIHVVPPGDSLLLAATAPLPEVLGDSLPAGTYGVRAQLELLNDELAPDRWATTYQLDAGHVELPRAPDPLPGSRIVDGLTYVATTRLVQGAVPGADTVRTLVLVRNDGTARVEAEVPRDCPVIAYAYRSAALRDSLPLQEPAWRGSRPCTLYPHRFALAPGESWVFAHDVPASQIVGATGRGRYWFTAWMAGRPDVKLAAGDVTLER